MPDTAANQPRYPQPLSQAAGVGFAHIRMVSVTRLAKAGRQGQGKMQQTCYWPLYGEEGEVAFYVVDEPWASPCSRAIEGF